MDFHFYSFHREERVCLNTADHYRSSNPNLSPNPNPNPRTLTLTLMLTPTCTVHLRWSAVFRQTVKEHECVTSRSPVTLSLATGNYNWQAQCTDTDWSTCRPTTWVGYSRDSLFSFAFISRCVNITTLRAMTVNLQRRDQITSSLFLWCWFACTGTGRASVLESFATKIRFRTNLGAGLLSHLRLYYSHFRFRSRLS